MTITAIRPIEFALLAREVDDLMAGFPELEEDEQLRADMVEGETSASDLVTRAIAMAQEADMMMASLDLKAEHLSVRRARWEKRSSDARRLALRIMEVAGLKRLKLADVTVSVANKPPALQVVDPEQIPATYMKSRITKSIDRTAVKEALLNGVTIPGAYMDNGGTSLRLL